jgi:2-succinyl-5-enolpyruvyl-6-hydroxy-3-cyclohexene-1-carboxylate synthase
MSTTAPNPSVAMATVVMDELVRNGVRHVVLAPGSRSGALAMVAAADDRIHLHVAIDERSAGFWAVGFGKVTGGPAAVLTTSGTAVANLYPAVVEADQSASPLFVISADRPMEFRQSGANQTIDQVKIFGDRVRFFADLPAAADYRGEPTVWRSLVCQALGAARRGPVHLNLAFREPLVPASDDGRAVALPYQGDLSGRSDGGPWTRFSPQAVEPTPLEIGGRTLIVAGPGADQALVEEALAAGMVVVAEGHSGCRLPGTISTAHHLLGAGMPRGALSPERAVVLGNAGLSRPLLSLLGEVETTVVANSWFDPSRQGARIVAAATWETADPDEEWSRIWHQADDAARSALDQVLDGWTEVTEPRTARDLVASLPDGAVLAVASSMPVRDIDWFAAPRTGLDFVSNRGASGIDGFLSLAAGAAAGVSREGRQLVGLVGDLSFLHDANGLLTEPVNDLVLVLVNNRGGGIFSFLPQADYPEHFERIFGTPRPVDFEGLTRALGASHTLVEEPADLSKAVGQGLSQGGVEVIEVRTERRRNVELHRQVTAAVTAAVEPLFQS